MQNDTCCCCCYGAAAAQYLATEKHKHICCSMLSLKIHKSHSFLMLAYKFKVKGFKLTLLSRPISIFCHKCISTRTFVPTQPNPRTYSTQKRSRSFLRNLTPDKMRLTRTTYATMSMIKCGCNSVTTKTSKKNSSAI